MATENFSRLTGGRKIADIQFDPTLIGYPKSYLSRFTLENNVTNPTYQIDIGPGECRSDDDTTDIAITGTNTLDLTTDLDTGSEAASTWYYIWVFKHPTTLATTFRFSISSTSPTQPAGYTKQRRLGSYYNDSGSNLLVGKTFGDRLRMILYDDADVGEVLSGGTAATYANVSCVNYVPPTSTLVTMLADSADEKKSVWLRKDGSSAAWQSFATGGFADVTQELSSSQVVDYKGEGQAIDLYIKGFWEEV